MSIDNPARIGITTIVKSDKEIAFELLKKYQEMLPEETCLSEQYDKSYHDWERAIDNGEESDSFGKAADAALDALNKVRTDVNMYARLTLKYAIKAGIFAELEEKHEA